MEAMSFLQILIGIFFWSYINIADNYMPYNQTSTADYYYDNYYYDDYDYYDDYEYEYLMETFSWISDEIIKNDWITIDMYYEENLAWQDFYAIAAYPNRTESFNVEDFTDEDVIEYMVSNIDMLYYYWHVFGAFVNNWKVYLDVSLAIPEKCKDNAIELWEKYNSRAIYDLKNMKEIPRTWNIEINEFDEYEVWDDLDKLYSLWCFDY